MLNAVCWRISRKDTRRVEGLTSSMDCDDDPVTVKVKSSNSVSKKYEKFFAIVA